MVMNISCKYEKSTYNTLASRGVTRKSLHTAAVAYSCVIHSIHRMLYGRYYYCSAMQQGTKQAISARERALCQLTVCFDRRKKHKSCALEMVFGRKLRR